MNNYFWAKYLREMGRDTVRAWSLALPKMIAVLVAGWLCKALTISVLGPYQERFPWLCIFLFSCGLVAELAGIILAIRFAGDAAGLWDELPPNASAIGRREPLLKVLSISLLPFIGVYSVFGGIQQSTYELTVQGVLESGSRFNATATAILTPHNAKERWIMVAILVGAYVTRRLLETAAERFKSTLLGVLASLVEGFFSVVIIFGGAAILRRVNIWLEDRVVIGWIEAIFGRFGEVLSKIHVQIPDFLTASWSFFTDQIWSTFVAGIVQPVLWLAAAGLVFGTYTLSLSELWEKGHEAEHGVVDPRLVRLAALEQKALHASGRTRKTVGEFFEAFWDDLEDRILPFIEALRHIMRVGVSFLGAYVLLYAGAQLLTELLATVPRLLLGGRPWYVYFGLSPAFDLAHLTLTEPVRLALLAVAMKVTVSANREVDEDQRITREGGDDGMTAAPIPAGGGRHVQRKLPAVLVALACVIACGVVNRLVDAPSPPRRVKAGIGVDAKLGRGQYLRVTQVDASQKVRLSNVELPGLGSEQINLAVHLTARTENGQYYTNLACLLHTTDSDGQVAIVRPTQENGFVLPHSGFQASDMQLIYERPRTDLVGAKLVCKPRGTFTAYEPELIFDLGIDEARASQLLSAQRPIDIPKRRLEALR